MSEDGEKDQEKKDDASSRPVSASARRKQRSSGEAASSGRRSGTAKRAAPQGKSSAGNRAKVPQGKGQGSANAAGKAKTEGKNEPTPKRSGRTRQREALPRRIMRFLREVWGELKKVVWPTRKQMGTYTIVVFVFLAFMIGLVFGLDFVFNQAVTLVFGE